MSDAQTPPPAVPDATAPAVPAAEPVIVAAPAVPAKKKRGVGVWSFILGLLAVLADLAVIVFFAATLLGTLGSLGADQGGTLTGALATVLAAGLVGVIDFWVGFVLAGLAVVLGLIALVTGRGRVLGVFGFLLGAAAIGLRLILLLSGTGIGNGSFGN